MPTGDPFDPNTPVQRPDAKSQIREEGLNKQASITKLQEITTEALAKDATKRVQYQMDTYGAHMLNQFAKYTFGNSTGTTEEKLVKLAKTGGPSKVINLINTFIKNAPNKLFSDRAMLAILADSILEILVNSQDDVDADIARASEQAPWKAELETDLAMEELFTKEVMGALDRIYFKTSAATPQELLGKENSATTDPSVISAIAKLKTQFTDMATNFAARIPTAPAGSINQATIDDLKAKAPEIITVIEDQITKMDKVMERFYAKALLSFTVVAKIPTVEAILGDRINPKLPASTEAQKILDITKCLSGDLPLQIKKFLLEYYPGLKDLIIADINRSFAKVQTDTNAIDTAVKPKADLINELESDLEMALAPKSRAVNAQDRQALTNTNLEANKQELERIKDLTEKLDLLLHAPTSPLVAIQQAINNNPILAADHIRDTLQQTEYWDQWVTALGEINVDIPQGGDINSAMFQNRNAREVISPAKEKQLQELLDRAREMQKVLSEKVTVRFNYLDRIGQALPGYETEVQQIESRIDNKTHNLKKMREALDKTKADLKISIEHSPRLDDDKFTLLQLQINKLKDEVTEANRDFIIASNELELVDRKFADLLATHTHTAAELKRIANQFRSKIIFQDYYTGEALVAIFVINARQELEKRQQVLEYLLDNIAQLEAEYNARIAYTLVDKNDAKFVNSKYAQTIARKNGMWLRDVASGALSFFYEGEKLDPIYLHLDKHPAEAILAGRIEEVITMVKKAIDDSGKKYSDEKKMEIIAKIIKSVLKEDYDLFPYEYAFSKIPTAIGGTAGPNITSFAELDGFNASKQDYVIETERKNLNPAFDYLKHKVEDIAQLAMLVSRQDLGLSFKDLNPITVNKVYEAMEYEAVHMPKTTNREERRRIAERVLLVRRVREYLENIDPSFYTYAAPVAPGNPGTPGTPAPQPTVVPATPAVAPAVVPVQSLVRPTASGSFVPIGLANQPKVGPEIPFDEVPDNGKPVSPEVLDTLDLDLVNDQKPIAKPTVPDVSSGTDSDVIIPFDDITGTAADTSTAAVPAEEVTQIMPDQIQLDPIPNQSTVEKERSFNQALNDFGGRLRIPFYRFVTDPETWTKLAQGGDINPGRVATALHQYLEKDTELVASPAYQFLEIHLAKAAVDMHNLNQEYQIDYGIMNARNDMIALGFNTPTDTPKNIKKREDIGYYLAKRFGISPIYTILSEPKGTLDNVSYQDLIRLFNSKFSKAVEALDITDTDPAAIEAKLETISIPDKPKNSPEVIKMLARVISNNNKNKNAAAATTVGQLPEAPTAVTTPQQPAAPAQESQADTDEIGISDILAPNTTDPLGQSPAIAGLEAITQLEDESVNTALDRVDREKLQQDIFGLSSIPAIEQVVRSRIQEANPGASEGTIDRAKSELMDRLTESEESLPDNTSQQPVQAQMQDKGLILEPVRVRNATKPFTLLSNEEAARLNKQVQNYNVSRIAAAQLLSLLGLTEADLRQMAQNIIAEGTASDINTVNSRVKANLSTMLMNAPRFRTSIPDALTNKITEIIDSLPL